MRYCQLFTGTCRTASELLSSTFRDEKIFVSKILRSTDTCCVSRTPPPVDQSRTPTTMLPALNMLLLSVAVKHIVMFDFKPTTTDADLTRFKDALRALPALIPGMVSHELGEDLLFESGRKHPAGKNRRLCWTATFPTSELYDAYRLHPAHVALVTDLIQPALLRGSRAAIQYEVPRMRAVAAAMVTRRTYLLACLSVVAAAVFAHIARRHLVPIAVQKSTSHDKREHVFFWGSEQ